MSRFLEVALRNAARGFRVHPVNGKDPILRGWPHLATTDEGQICAWAEKYPDYNVGVAAGDPNPSAPFVVAIVDSDRVSRLQELAGPQAAEWFNTFSVSSGRPDRAHFYYLMTPAVHQLGNKHWAEPSIPGNVFELKVLGGQVVAEGSIHPVTGSVYKIAQDAPLILFPAGLCALMRECLGRADSQGREAAPVEGNRNNYLTSVAGKLRNAGLSRDALELALLQHNEDVCQPPLDDEEVKRIAGSVARYDVPGSEPEIYVGGKPAGDWRTHYHTFEEMQNAPPAAFLIEGFLQQDAITALAAPVAQRKSLIALNAAWALCTGESLFGYFKVIQQPTRVLYLCPEMGIRSFTDRLRKIKLMDHVGKTLFCRTMSAEGTLELSALTAEELSGAVVIIDTAVRYLRGDENSSEHMRAFADEVFRIMRDGALSVLLLHHSLKGTKESPDLSLENAMRGSGELGAFIASCWATRLQDPGSPYESASYLANVKQRDFESKPFEVTSGPDCRLHIVGEPGDHVKLNSKAVGAPGDKDGKEEAALQIIRANPDLSQAKLSHKLKEHGIERSPAWVGKKRLEMKYEDMQAGA